MKAKGEIGEQYHHAIDLVPTILDCLGVEPPETIGGHVQSEFDGVSMRHSFDHAAVPSERPTQFYSMLGSRAIWHNGWKAVTTHASVSGWGSFGRTPGSCTTPMWTDPSYTALPTRSPNGCRR